MSNWENYFLATTGVPMATNVPAVTSAPTVTGVSQCQDDLNECKAERDAIKNDLKKLLSKVQNVRTAEELEACKSELEQLKKDFVENKAALARCKSDNEQEIANLNAQLKGNVDKLQAAELMNRNLQHQISAQKDLLQGHLKKMGQFQQQISAQKQTSLHKLQEANLLNQKLQHQLETLQAENKKIHSEIIKLKSEHGDVTRSLQECQNEIKLKDKIISGKTKEIALQQREKQHWRDWYGTLLSETRSAKNLDELSKAIKELELKRKSE